MRRISPAEKTSGREVIFSEPAFLFYFFPLVLLVATVAPRNWRNTGLLSLSLLFYAVSDIQGLGLLTVLILGNAALGRRLTSQPDQAKFRGRRYLLLGLLLNLGPWGYFKIAPVLYLDWLPSPTPALPLVMPLGLSFYALHGVSYLVDVWRGKAVPARSVGEVGLFMAFFPQLLAGPILRYRQFASQVSAPSTTGEDWAEGSRRFLCGLAKKVLLAENLRELGATVLSMPETEWTPVLAWSALLWTAMGVYFDFSGYSDMAIGMARMLGFRIPENFRYPAVARSVTEFWLRWHISLTSWLRDYLLTPLNRHPITSKLPGLNLVVVFVAVGFWHGATPNFLLFGLWNGVVYLVEERFLKTGLPRLPGALRRAWCLGALLPGLLLFCTKDIGQAWTLANALCGVGCPAQPLLGPGYVWNSRTMALTLAALVCSLPVYPWSRDLCQRSALTWTIWRALRLLAMALLMLASLGAIAAQASQPFVYFRF